MSGAHLVELFKMDEAYSGSVGDFSFINGEF